MKRVECSQCDKTFTKGSAQAAELALAMHVGRVHTKTILNGRRGPGRPRKDEALVVAHAHEHSGNGNGSGLLPAVIEEPKRRGQGRSKLSFEERGQVLAFIREHNHDFSTKAECFRAAMEAAGITGKIKDNSVAVCRHYKLAFSDPTGEDPAPEPKQRRYRADIVDKVLTRHATPTSERFECPNCRYDFNVLRLAKTPTRFCPGCGSSLNIFINQLLALINP